MAFVDLTNMNLSYFLAAGGFVVALLALLPRFSSGSSARVPAVIVAAILGLGAGLALGVVLMGLLGYQTAPQTPPEPGSPEDPRRKMAAAAPGPGMPGQGMPGGVMPGGGAPGGGAPGPGKPGMGGPASAKVQLANLLGKVNLLTGNSLTLKLTDDQRKKVREQIAGLDKLEDLAEDDAQKRLDTLLTTLQGDKETLDAVNYRWSASGPRAPGGGPSPPPANPFREGAAHDQVQSLQKRLDTAAGGAKSP